MPAIRVRTSTGWQDLIVMGPSTAADASTGSKGVLQLAGDLGGTANLPTVPKLAAAKYQRIERYTNASAGNDYTTTSTTDVYVDHTNLLLTLTTSGRWVRMMLRGMGTNNTAMASMTISPRVDGATVANTPTWTFHAATAGAQSILCVSYDVQPSAGTHTFDWAFKVSSGTGTLYCRAGIPLIVTAEELPYG